ncbi:unnamed protein product [Chrysoparadoxa australica]
MATAHRLYLFISSILLGCMLFGVRRCWSWSSPRLQPPLAGAVSSKSLVWRSASTDAIDAGGVEGTGGARESVEQEKEGKSELLDVGKAPHPHIRTLSPTSFADYKKCPMLFKFRHVERQWEPDSPPLLRGLMIHEALAKLYDAPEGSSPHLPHHLPGPGLEGEMRESNPKLTLTSSFPSRSLLLPSIPLSSLLHRPEDQNLTFLHKTFRESWIKVRTEQADMYHKMFPTREEERSWGAESLNLLSNYVLMEPPVTVKPMWKEHRLYAQFEARPGDERGMNVTGILDRLDRTPLGKLEVIDYKTGRAPQLKYSKAANRRIMEDRFQQLKIYALLVQKELGEAPTALKLIYLDGPTKLTYPLTEGCLAEVEQDLRDTWKDIVESIETASFEPKVSRLCDWCSFQAICPAFVERGKEEELYK